MHINKEDIKRGIDSAAHHLKDAVDHIAESPAKVRDKARDAALKAGDELIDQGHKLKRAAAGGEEHDELREGTPPC
jgi:hypothetical protein